MSNVESHDSFLGFFLRLYWMLLGVVGLWLLLANIVTSAPTSNFSWMDAAALAIGGSLLLVRYIDIRWYKGTTKDGEPADLKLYRSYALKLILVLPLALVASHGLSWWLHR